MIDRRRIMMKQASGEAAPLYPFPTSTSGRFSGTGGNIVNYLDERGGTRCAGIYEFRTSTNSGAYTNRPKIFTIPAGSHVVETIKILEKTGPCSIAVFVVANSTSYALSNISGFVEGETYTVEKDFTADTDVGEFGVKVGAATPCGVKLEVTLTVDGVRYV